MSVLPSCLCTQERLASPEFRAWAERLREPARMNRKIWEWCYIAEALAQRGMLAHGKRGLGFAVGKEPLPSLFAAHGATIVATDLPDDRAAAAGWAATNQHAASLEALNERGLCPPELLRERVTFEPADMNRIPEHLRGFDFVWSACSLEHLGSIARGEQFVYNALACLEPGGVAVHTTEYNVSSNDDTVDHRSTVLLRRRDVERIAATLEAAGHRVAPLDLSPGDMPLDEIVDVPPYRDEPHLKVQIKRYVCTSVGFVVEKVTDRIPRAPRHATPPRLADRLRPWLRAPGRLMGKRSRRRAHEREP